jgi:hypothetical protein
LPNIVRLKKSRSIRWDEHFARVGDVLVMCLIALSVDWCAVEDLLTKHFTGEEFMVLKYM